MLRITYYLYIVHNIIEDNNKMLHKGSITNQCKTQRTKIATSTSTTATTVDTIRTYELLVHMLMHIPMLLGISKRCDQRRYDSSTHSIV